MARTRGGLSRRVGGHWEVEGTPSYPSFGLTIPSMWVSTMEVRDLDRAGITVRPEEPVEGRPERRVLSEEGLAAALAMLAR
jgi:hypothetical protein